MQTNFIRMIPPQNGEKKVYLTFDDGPHETATNEVLEVLKSEKVPATFFIIGNKALPLYKLIHRIEEEGHAIGNHSIDHGYLYNFFGRKRILEWLERSENLIRYITGHSSVGFRPPAGLCLPALSRAVSELKIPLYLWNVRFYDTFRPWTLESALQSVVKMKSGSIVLLHDAQRRNQLADFNQTLKRFISELKTQGFSFDRLPARAV